MWDAFSSYLYNTVQTRVLTRPLADLIWLIAAPFVCGEVRQERHLDHFLNPAHSSYYPSFPLNISIAVCREGVSSIPAYCTMHQLEVDF